jgi:U6 snRNA-associated Sm-like protein LSm6
MENGTQSEGKDPSSFLSEIIGNAVTVKLNSGVVYKGKPIPPRPLDSIISLVIYKTDTFEQASCSLSMVT